MNYNTLWTPLFILAEKLKLRMPQTILRENMIPSTHIINLLQLSQLGLVYWGKHILMPVNIPLLSWLANRFFASFFPFRLFSSTDILIARPLKKRKSPITCSVIVPCKNERGHIEDIASRMPQLTQSTEIVFVDDKSDDNTADEMRRMQKLYPQHNILIVDGPGIGKAEAVRAGIHVSKGDIIAILDADLAVAPEELPKCIQPLLDSSADFVNTVRFVYPQDAGAMRFANIIGNRAFALVFTFLLRQRITDTLSGTKVFWREDYAHIDRLKTNWIWRDKWGDFEQLLGASKMGLKIVDIPVHYMERTYGKTKMNKRFQNGVHMLKLCLGGLLNLRFK